MTFMNSSNPKAFTELFPNKTFALNLGTPVVISEPKSTVAKQLQQLAELYAPVDAGKARKGWRR